MDKLTYYDFLANLLPGIIFLWVAPLLGPFENIEVSALVTGSNIVDAILVVAVSFVIGHVLQFISKYTVEPLIKLFFWHRHFFSEIYLVKFYGAISDVELSRIISQSENQLEYKSAELGILIEKAPNTEQRRMARELSQSIYRTIDAKTKDQSLAEKAHIQNTFYSMFRNLSGIFIVLGLTVIATAVFQAQALSLHLFLIVLANFLLGFIFLTRAKQRGELYVRGLFQSYF